MKCPNAVVSAARCDLKAALLEPEQDEMQDATRCKMQRDARKYTSVPSVSREECDEAWFCLFLPRLPPRKKNKPDARGGAWCYREAPASAMAVSSMVCKYVPHRENAESCFILDVVLCNGFTLLSQPLQQQTTPRRGRSPPATVTPRHATPRHATPHHALRRRAVFPPKTPNA